MITADAFQIFDPVGRRFLQWEIVALRPGLEPARWGLSWYEDPQQAGAWKGAGVDTFIAERSTRAPELEGITLEKVPAPACGCCGAMPRAIVEGRYQLVLNLDWWRGRRIWRCEKHVGRAPCCIEGCGKTWALQPDDTYSTRFICGRHWREAPLWMRQRVTKIRKLARRRGWDDQICRLHSMAWDACYRAVIRRRSISADEILPTSEPPPPAVLAELARMGL
jgi:hypothetical protein